MSGQCGEANLSLLRYHALIPAPTNERQALEREREELPGQIATYQAELDASDSLNQVCQMGLASR